VEKGGPTRLDIYTAANVGTRGKVTEGTTQTTTFDIDGFLSDAMTNFKSNVRGDSRFKGWFDFADDLNRLALAMLCDREIDRKNKPGLCIALFFIRAHHSFQSTLILTELGLLNDARVVLRSTVEGVIAINSISADPKFLTKLSEAHFYNQSKTARLALEEPTYRAHQTPDKIAQMEAMVRDVNDMERKEGRRLRDINWREAAESHSVELYDLLYRPLSSDGTHSNMAALYRFAEFDSDEI
jgi:hypothetical protein